jgi:origin recognition complex subunit 5
VAELAGARLLVRASPPERLDGPPTFRAAIAHADALVLAKDFKIALHELLWEAA